MRPSFGSNGARNGGRTPEPAPGVVGRFFYFGLGVKRWLLITAAGIVVSSTGLAIVIKRVLSPYLPNLLPWQLEGVILAIVGLTAILFGIYGLYRSVGPLLFSSSSIDALTHTLYTRRSLGRGPKIVVIGGGIGLSVLLRGLKVYTDNLTAIVTVADDGGSSGRLRREMGVIPPGDFRACLVALSDDETLVSELFQYRFDQGNGLEGHSFGNLFIVAMSNVTGSFEEALYESSRVLKVRGQILPATMANLHLKAIMKDGRLVQGESAITGSGGPIDRVLIEPHNVEAYQPAVDAIRETQLIVMGPGSLYTSLLPNLLVSGIAEAIKASDARKIYVCNVATQPGETDGYSVEDHVEALQAHTFPTIADRVIANDRLVEPGPRFEARPVGISSTKMEVAKLVTADLVENEHPLRHDPVKLAKLVIDVYDGNETVLASAAPTTVG